MFKSNSVAPVDDNVFESDGSGASTPNTPSIQISRHQDEVVDAILHDDFGRRNSSFEPATLLTVPTRSEQRRHSLAANPTPSYGASLFPQAFGTSYDLESRRTSSTYSIDRLVPPMSPGGFSVRSNWSELIRLADKRDSIDSIDSYHSNTIAEPKKTISGISSAISERLLDLVASFSSRTERFKERTVQPPTPSTDSDTKSATSMDQKPKIFRLASLVPISSRNSGNESAVEEMFLESKCCKIKIPQCLRYLNPTRTIDPTGKAYLMWLLLVTLAFMYNVTAVPLRASFVQAEFYHKEVTHRTVCEYGDSSVTTGPTHTETSTSDVPEETTNSFGEFTTEIYNISVDTTTLGNITCRNITTTKTKYYPGIETDENRKYWWMLDYISDFIYLIDMLFIKPKIHFVKNGLTERGKKECLKHYYSSKIFLYDLAALTPLDLFYLVPVFNYNAILRLPRFFKIFAFWEFYHRMDQIVNNSHIIRVLRTLTYMLFLIHIESCGYYIASAYEGLDRNEWVYSGRGRAYIRCMYLATKTATSIGNNPKPQNQLEWSFMTLYWLSGVFVFAMLIGQIRDIFQAANAAKTNFRDTMDKTISYMNSFNVPDKVQNKVRAWFNYNWKHQKTFNENLLLEALPRKMKADLAIHVHYDILSKVQLFQDCDKMLLFDLVLKLKPILYLPKDYICLKGEVGTEMYIVMLGQVEVVGGAHNDIIFATLHQGSVFGEISLLALAGGNRRTANVRSKGFSQLFTLSKNDFEEAMADYPEAQKILKKKAKKLLARNVKAEDTIRKDETIIKPKEDTPKMLTTVVKIIEPESKIHDYLGTRRYSRKTPHPIKQNMKDIEDKEDEEDEILIVEQIERPISEAELKAYADKDKSLNEDLSNKATPTNDEENTERVCETVNSLDQQIADILDSPEFKGLDKSKVELNIDSSTGTPSPTDTPSPQPTTSKSITISQTVRKIVPASNKVAPEPEIDRQSATVEQSSIQTKSRNRVFGISTDSPNKVKTEKKGNKTLRAMTRPISDKKRKSGPETQSKDGDTLPAVHGQKVELKSKSETTLPLTVGFKEEKKSKHHPILPPIKSSAVKTIHSRHPAEPSPTTPRRDSVVITVQKCHVSPDGTVTCVPAKEDDTETKDSSHEETETEAKFKRGNYARRRSSSLTGWDIDIGTGSPVELSEGLFNPTFVFDEENEDNDP